MLNAGVSQWQRISVRICNCEFVMCETLYIDIYMPVVYCLLTVVMLQGNIVVFTICYVLSGVTVTYVVMRALFT